MELYTHGVGRPTVVAIFRDCPHVDGEPDAVSVSALRMAARAHVRLGIVDDLLHGLDDPPELWDAVSLGFSAAALRSVLARPRHSPAWLARLLADVRRHP